MEYKKVENISHVYKGLLERNRAYASFRLDELNIIHSNLKSVINPGDWILDPMSGYGGTMSYFGCLGYKTYNLEINPPSYYWQILINPSFKHSILSMIESIIQNKKKLPILKSEFSVSESFFTKESYVHIKKLHEFIIKVQPENTPDIEKLSTAIILPFVSRFANYVKSEANLTHFKEGGFCSYNKWKEDFLIYLDNLKRLVSVNRIENQHENYLADLLELNNIDKKFQYFITSPPYPNYRDYSKIFKIENRVLSDVFNIELNFENLMGSNNVSGKNAETLISQHADEFLDKLLHKSKTLNKKSRRDIEVYYYPYFAIYFTQLQKAFIKLNELLNDKAIGYIVVNDNIIRDIIVPVCDSICDIFKTIGFNTEIVSVKQMSHYGNIGSAAKRINSYHTRHILKVWRT